MKTPGHPVLLGRDAWPLLEGLEGDVGARGVISAHPELVETVEIEEHVPRDVDTWEDYEVIRGDRQASSEE